MTGATIYFDKFEVKFMSGLLNKVDISLLSIGDKACYNNLKKKIIGYKEVY